MKPEIVVDVVFERICFALPTGDFDALERSIKLHGCREPLVVWAETGILLDGHHRRRICEAHGIAYSTVSYSFASRHDAHDFVIRNQLARRNLSPQQAQYLRGKIYNDQKLDRVGNLKQGAEPQQPSVRSEQSETTAERIGRETGVSSASVRRDAKRATAIDAIAETAGPEARDVILSGGVRLSAADLDDLASAAPTTVEQVEAFGTPEAKEKRLRERRAPNGQEAWGQFEVVETIPTPDGEWVHSRRLSCGHTVEAARRVEYREGRGTKSANCPTCRPGTRTPHEKRRVDRSIERALAVAWSDRDLRPLVVEFVGAALRALAFGPHQDARAESLLQRCTELKHELRLTETDDA